MKQVMSCLQYVPANEIWSTATSFIDEGERRGLVRGYNVEVTTRDGKVDWMSCVWIHGTIEEYLKDEYTGYWYADCGVTPTGRISFRGYGMEEYDYEERDTFIIHCDADGNPIQEKR